VALVSGWDSVSKKLQKDAEELRGKLKNMVPVKHMPLMILACSGRGMSDPELAMLLFILLLNLSANNIDLFMAYADHLPELDFGVQLRELAQEKLAQEKGLDKTWLRPLETKLREHDPDSMAGVTVALMAFHHRHSGIQAAGLRLLQKLCQHEEALRTQPQTFKRHAIYNFTSSKTDFHFWRNRAFQCGGMDIAMLTVKAHWDKSPDCVYEGLNLLCAFLSEKEDMPRPKDITDKKDVIRFTKRSTEAAAHIASIENGIGIVIRILLHPPYQDNIRIQFICLRFLCLLGKHKKYQTHESKILDAEIEVSQNVERLLKANQPALRLYDLKLALRKWKQQIKAAFVDDSSCILL